MMALGARGQRLVAVLWRASRPLTLAGLGFLPVLLGSVLGLMVDDRVITGSPAWLKPTKFAVSSGIYCLTLAGVFAAVGQPTRLMRLAGWLVAVVLVLEVGIIDVQAARGVTSHFNVATPLDAQLYATMGVAIAVLLVASLTVAVELCRMRIADRVLGWTVRLGMVVTVVGSTTGGLMTQPSAPQRVQIQAAAVVPRVGAHLVGAPDDGGAGLPITRWSRDHGDLRVPHFFGLHAIQAIPLLSWLALAGLPLRREGSRLALVSWIALSYLGLIALLTRQALAGRPVVSVDPASLGWWAAWGILTSVGVAAVVVRDRSEVRLATNQGLLGV